MPRSSKPTPSEPSSERSIKTAHHGIASDGCLDFSRGGPAEGTLELVDAINKRIDEALEEKARAEFPRTYLGGSRLGHECRRALAYEYFEAHEVAGEMRRQEKAGQKPRNPKMRFPGKLLRVFRDGHRIEDQVISDLRGAGFTVFDRDPATGRQFGWAVAPDESGRPRVKGHLDGIVTAGPIHSIGYPCLLEIKSMNNKKHCAFKDNGVKSSHPIYYYQMQVYMAYYGLTNNPAWFVAYNKDNSEYHHEFVPYDQAAVQLATDNGVVVLEAKSPRDIPRGGANERAPPCLWCSFKTECWAPEAPAPAAATTATPDWLKNP